MKVCYILCYYFPEYVRTKTLISGLEGIEEIQVTKLLNKNSGWLRYFETIAALIKTRIVEHPDVYILGFRGYEIFWPVRWITRSKPLIFDHMMSPYDSLVFERKRIKEKSPAGRFVFRYEQSLLAAADGIITDTINHKNRFVELFGTNPQKITPIHVSTEEDLFRPLPAEKNDGFEVFFYGSFLPLHGVPYILQAAKQVSDLPIHFHLVGGNKKDMQFFRQQVEKLGLSNITHIPWIDYQDLPAVIAQADICLGGPFGNTGQAQRVITGKTFQFLAMEKPTVIGRIEPNPGFRDHDNCLLVPQANPSALAEAVRWAFQHQSALPEIAFHGRQLYEEKFSNRVVAEELRVVLDQIREERLS